VETYSRSNIWLGRESFRDILLGQYILGLIEPRSRGVEVGIAYMLAEFRRMDIPRSALELNGVLHSGGPKSSTSTSGRRALLPPRDIDPLSRAGG
jgi:hypothetical protein